MSVKIRTFSVKKSYKCVYFLLDASDERLGSGTTIEYNLPLFLPCVPVPKVHGCFIVKL